MNAFKRAFTLVEVMLVVSIIAILSVMAIPNMLSYKRLVQEKSCKATINRLVRAVESYTTRTGKTPSNIEELTKGDAPFLKSVPSCPYGGSYMLETDSVKGFVIKCSAHDSSLHNVND